ncbi:leucine-rich repeat domain-containing protein [Promethearchaeum syntrophicum]|uniref:Leucine-rich repeat domain-containing protein n=1 Tax=Promethearchaeum syntrophicum TaxID=2594042 RepID=A0A5B9DCL0_9ARCH|nr:leucine-rich repeat domain-containing protein [Candidatus Prometheoarchaeum syntrophicum]QEE16745.1 Leucine Rich repeats (2 copies) [Candidatus Prometheoarchaeum syntrophicum]
MIKNGEMKEEDILINYFEVLFAEGEIMKKANYETIDDHIVTLDLSECHIKELPDSIGNLKKLEKLFLNKNELRELPESIGNLINLNVLNIESNLLKNLPNSLRKLSNLKDFRLNDNLFEGKIPEIITSFNNLRILEISRNSIENLPEKLCDLKKLHRLNLNDNKIVKLPKFMGELQELEYLNLSNNNISFIPESMSKLTKLKNVLINNNSIKTFQNLIGENNNLQAISLKNNNLTKIPDSIKYLKKLKRIDISKNKITELNRSLTGLADLEYLNIENNLLIKLPDSIGNIKIFEIDGNYIEDIPPQLRKDEKIRPKIENSFNFPLIFNYFPEYQKNPDKYQYYLTLQKRLILKLRKESMKSYFWTYIKGIKKKTASEITQPWNFVLYKLNHEKNKVQREIINFRNDGKPLHLEHSHRTRTFLQFQAVFKCKQIGDWESKYKYLALLIRNLVITVETDKGGIMPLKFTDFYFKKTESGIEYQSIAFLKIDQSYSLEPFAKLNFNNVKIDYESNFLPKTSIEEKNLRTIKDEIKFLKDEIHKLVSSKSTKPRENSSNIEYNRKNEGNTYKKHQDKEINEIIKNFKNKWIDDGFPIIILKIGHGFSSKLGKLTEYLAASIIFASAFPSIFKFIYRLIIGLISMEEGMNFLQTDINIIEIPLWFELISYLPLIVLFFYLLIKFLLKHRITKN